MQKAEYYITDGKKFVRQDVNGCYKIVTNMAMGETWNNPRTAKAILNNSLPNAWRKTFYVAKCEDGDLIKWSLTVEEKDEFRSDIITANEDKKAYKLELYSFEDDEGIQNIIQGIDKINSMLNDTENLHLKLQEELATLEFMLEDLKHYRLKKKLGTVDSYKFKKLGDVIVLKRMSIKNQLDILYKINQYRSVIQNPIKDICSTIESVKNKKYKPRVLLELFEDDNLEVEVI